MHTDPVFEHAVVAADFHAGRVRIVRNEEVAKVTEDLRLLFPHSTPLAIQLGCCHTCLYTDDAPASLVGERIAEHARLFDHETGEARIRRDSEHHEEGLGKKAALM